MRIAIVGYHGAGKTTLFRVLGGKANPPSGKAPILNLLNHKVPDHRLDRVAREYKSEKVSPAVIEFLDVDNITGGEKALSDEFLGHARACDALLLLVRAFVDDNIYNPRGTVDPIRDLRHLCEELILSDLEVVDNRLHKLTQEIGRGKKEGIAERDLLMKVKDTLEKEQPLREADFKPDDEKVLSHFAFMSQKPVIGIVNVNYKTDKTDISRCLNECGSKGIMGIGIPVGLECELMDIDNHDEKLAFLNEYGYGELCSDFIVKAAYDILDAITFYVANDKEARALQLKKGSNAYDAAGKVHTDIQKGFVRAEVYNYNDLDSLGSLKALKDSGKSMLEKKEYIVKDGDVIFFRFN
jgi:GTP-binding protein YchF